MKILVTFAVETEFAPWKKALKLRARVGDGVAIHQSEIGGVNVDFVVTGMGAENASRCAEILMRKSYDLVIAAGFAGALRSDLNAGEVIASSAVQQLNSRQTINSNRDLVARAAANGAKIIETLVSVDNIVATVEQKSQLAPFANAADMESFAILSAANTHSIPAVAIRVISDSLQQDLPAGVDALVHDAGGVHVPGVVKYFAGHPLAVPAVLRLGRRSKSAAETLKRFLESYIRSLLVAPDIQPREELEGVAAR